MYQSDCDGIRSAKNPRGMKTSSPTLLFALLALPSLSGQTITGYTLSGGDLSTITVNGSTLAVGDLVESTLTAANDVNGAQIIVGVGNTPPSPNSSVMSDTSITTGLLNVETSTFTFNQPIQNIPGIDLFIFDWGAYGSNDDLRITINSITSPELNPDGSLPSGYSYHIGSFAQKVSGDIFANASNYSTVAELNALTLTASGDSTGIDSGVLGIDLDNFSVAANATITSVTVFDTDSTVDPVLVMGVATIPEPGVYALVFGAAASWLILRRRRSSEWR